MVVRSKRSFVVRGKRMKRSKTIKSKINKLERRQRDILKSQDLHSLQNLAEAQAATTTMDPYLLNGISQGDDISSRESNDIYMTSLSGVVSFIAGDATNVCRCLIVYDKQPNGAIFNQGDIIQGSSTAQTSEPIKAQRKDYMKRFKFLYDKIVSVGTGDLVKTIRFRIPIKRKALYGGSGGTVASITTGSLYLVIISDSTAPTNPTHTHAVTLNWKG